MKLSLQAHSHQVSAVGDGPPLEAYLKALVANTASDFFRAKYAQRRNAGRTTSLDQELIQPFMKAGSGPEEMNHRVLMSQIEQRFAGSPRDLTIFRLYFIQSFTAKEIAAIPALQLSEKGVESLIRRMKEAARKTMEGERISRKGWGK